MLVLVQRLLLWFYFGMDFKELKYFVDIEYHRAVYN